MSQDSDGAGFAVPSTGEDLARLVTSFEDCSLPKAQWTHAAHLVVGSHYVFTLGMPRALDEMRRRVRSYNEAVGGRNTDTSGYHETLTALWLMLLQRLHRRSEASTALELAQTAVAAFGDRRDLHACLYTRDIVKDVEARRTWILPEHPFPEGL